MDKSLLAPRKRKNQESVSELVRVVDSVPVVSTLDMWEGLGVNRHRALTDLIKKYENLFQDIRTFSFLKGKSTGGRQGEFCYLDEEQATFLITLMKNSKPVVKFKHRLSREFYRMKTEIVRLHSFIHANRQNTIWLETRNAGKEPRAEFTLAIKTLQDTYGDKHFYSNYTLLGYEALFGERPKAGVNRDMLDCESLGKLGRIETHMASAIMMCISFGISHKEIYLKVKKSAIDFGMRIGRCAIPMIENHVQQLSIGMGCAQ